jgi:hypothetical protein
LIKNATHRKPIIKQFLEKENLKQFQAKNSTSNFIEKHLA